MPPLRATRVLDQLRERLRLMHYSVRTEETYVYWVKAFIRFHGLRHPAEMGGPEVGAFLTHLADDRSVAPSTHSQALSALLFFYTKVLHHDLTPPIRCAMCSAAPRCRLAKASARSALG